MGQPSSPFLDTWAPAQYVYGGTGGAGPARSPGGTAVNSTQATTSYDSLLHYKLAGTVILALLMVFVLQKLGFRFVIGAGIGG